METAATKALIYKVLEESFNKCIEDWNINEVESQQLLNAIAGPETIERIHNVTHIAGMYADEGKILLHATLKGIAVPADGKPIKLTFEVGNTHDRRMKIADIGYPVVDIFALPESMKPEEPKPVTEDSEQLDIEDYAAQEDEDEEG